MEINFFELWGRMGFPVRAVVFVLTCQALACVTVVIERIFVLYQSNARARAFAAEAQSALDAGQYEQALQLFQSAPFNHLASYLQAGLGTFITRVRAGDAARRAADLAKRALEPKGEDTSRDFNSSMNGLALMVLTALFVG